MAGEIDVTIVGHAARLMFQGDRIVLCCNDLKSTVGIMRAPTPDLKPLGKLFSFSEIAFDVQIGDRKPLEIFPEPGRLARWFSPKVR
ncbi:MAG: hypothetical protein P8J33_17510, partial [Pirellulaceae bacterium]|nr:hypothetical protein [Pirellulaceae bacterium]